MREPKWSCALICSARPGDVARPFLSGLTAAVNHRLQISQSEILAINHVWSTVRAGGITIWDVRDFNHCCHSVCLGRCIFVSVYFSPAELYTFYYPKVFYLVIHSVLFICVQTVITFISHRHVMVCSETITRDWNYSCFVRSWKCLKSEDEDVESCDFICFILGRKMDI